MNKRTFTIVLGLELYAVLLGVGQYLLIGLRTDEAKYLLDIPYPHPPLVRWILSLTDVCPYQEIFWRIVFATLLVQAAWIVWSIARDLPRSLRTIMAGAWLLSSAVVLQAGTIMMAPLTALEALVFVHLLFSRDDHTHRAWMLGLLWMASLFTAYQAVLFFPLALAVFWRMRLPRFTRLVLFVVPVVLLGLYTLINPLALASMFLHAEKDAVQTVTVRLIESGVVFLLGGSVILSILGTAGILLSRRVSLMLSLLLVAAYVFIGKYDYYAVLFLPLFMAGLITLARLLPAMVKGVIVLVPVGTILLVWSFPRLIPAPTAAPRQLMDIIGQSDRKGDVLIVGPFGHEWQYVSSRPVRRYQARLLPEAAAVICLRPCEEMQRQPQWEQLAIDSLVVWVRLR